MGTQTPVTLAQANAEVRALLDEYTQAFWLDSQIDSWINQGCLDVARNGQSLWQFVTIDVVVGQQNYNVPADFLGAHRLVFNLEGSNQFFNLKYKRINSMDEIWGILQTLPAAYPYTFSNWINTETGGQYLIIYPVPAAAGAFELYYYREPVVAVAPSDNIDVAVGWEDTVYEYTLYKALRKDHDPRWQDSYGMYQAMLQNHINKTTDWTDLGSEITSEGQYYPVGLFDGSDGFGW